MGWSFEGVFPCLGVPGELPQADRYSPFRAGDSDKTEYATVKGDLHFLPRSADHRL
ncbi:hypothetical protein VT98_11403 [Candidatus Electrothrix communis]|uniref:Uncharacterized protein n=1 Tax=Candidatus Electrothrix communis TaxID=1859133 RepID=A0A3S3UEQ4_9BACT|nr:hypothetical protein VT98_11403 [Candidatus Electrothrix communis]